jgi:hypothetical protein
METMVRRYKSDKQYRRDAVRLAAGGWRVVNVVQEQPPTGCGRGCLLGFFALIFKPKPRLVVTYERG